MWVLPPGKYKSELVASHWVLGLKVQATVAAINAKENRSN